MVYVCVKKVLNNAEVNQIVAKHFTVLLCYKNATLYLILNIKEVKVSVCASNFILFH